MPANLVIACAFGLVCGMSAHASKAGATFTGLGDLPGGEFASHAFGVSDDGQVVVGWSKAVAGVGSGEFRAYRWTPAAGMQPLGHLGPPTVPGIARAVSRDGQVIIGSCGPWFIWTQKTGMVAIDGPCHPLDLSADGSVMVGQCVNGPDLEAATWNAIDGWVSHGALGIDPVDAFFSGVSADGTIACGQSMVVLPDVEPTRWTQRTGIIGLGDVPGGAHYALAWDIAADGSTIVGEAIGDVGQDAFVWTAEDGLVNLEAGAAGVTESAAAGVSGDGSIIVGYANNGINAMMWDRAHGMRSIQQMLIDDHGLELPGWTLLGASAISADGLTIIGHGLNPQGKIEAWRIGLPEPAPVPGDVTGDGAVDIDDLLAVINAWGSCGATAGECPADVDADGDVDVDDLLMVINNWT